MIGSRPGLPEPVRIMRVIARLNMGGPALHVSYLSRGLDERGYQTTLLAGELARGEDSMAFVARDAGIDVAHVPHLHREISPVSDPIAISRLLHAIKQVKPHILHTHTAKAGAVGRTAALLAGSARPPVIVHTYHGHVLRGYFDPIRTRAFLETERALARADDAPDRSRSGRPRRPRRARRRAGGEVQRHPPRDRPRQRASTATAAPSTGACSASPRIGSSSAGSAG